MTKIEEQIAEFTKKILELIGIDGEVKISKTEKSILVEINSNSNGLLIGKQGQNLQAFERILLVLFYQKLSANQTLTVDVGGFRQKRTEFIQNLAESSIQEVLTTKLPKTLSGLTAAERKIVHLEVAKHKELASESQGAGVGRVLIIKYR